jgi:hypothetical protein
MWIARQDRAPALVRRRHPSDARRGRKRTSFCAAATMLIKPAAAFIVAARRSSEGEAAARSSSAVGKASNDFKLFQPRCVSWTQRISHTHRGAAPTSCCALPPSCVGWVAGGQLGKRERRATCRTHERSSEARFLGAGDTTPSRRVARQSLRSATASVCVGVRTFASRLADQQSDRGSRRGVLALAAPWLGLALPRCETLLLDEQPFFWDPSRATLAIPR